MIESYDASIPLSFGKRSANGSARDARLDLELSLAPGALKRVLINLISNAQLYGRQVRVHVDGRDIHVIDRGPGIADEFKEQVFQPFFRLDRSRSRATGGSGLGLAIVQQLCQAHGWRVRIDDVPGGGTDMVVTLA